jgi:hypothetical protein
MPTIKIEKAENSEETGDQIAIRVSNALHELYPAVQWGQAMRAMVHRLNQEVRETGENVAPQR